MAIKPIKVSQLNGYIKRILSTDPLLGNVSVTGEISNLKYHSSGHVYFSLKDDKSKINCFLAASVLEKIRYELEEGMEIIIGGYISVYEPAGYYSLNVRDIEVSGKGDLAVAFEKLKNKLAQEGLFDEGIKKTIPPYPQKIAVVTAETGAAVKDILKIITSKNNITDVIVYPVLVQGPKAAADISKAIEDINCNMKDVETIIVGRGGGSLEDLWAFNEEKVARAIYNSDIPIISAVGHEIDVTISDFVADYRAETPTAAANYAVPDTGELRKSIDQNKVDLIESLQSVYKEKQKQLDNLNLDLFGRMIENRLDYAKLKIDNTIDKNTKVLNDLILKKETKMELAKAKLENRSPERILKKGYVALTDSNGAFVRKVTELKEDDQVKVVGYDATAEMTVNKIIENNK